MDTGDLKKLLKVAAKQPVNCAVGLNGDKDAVIDLSKSRAGKVLLKEMMAEEADLSLGAFGTVTVDADTDPKCAIFELNKAPGALNAKLVKALKGTGIKSVTLT